MRLILIRHGETVENAGGLVQGHIPGMLSDLGREQARAVGRYLKDEIIDAFYASDLDRAFITSQLALGPDRGALVAKDVRMREQSFGVFEGKPLGDIVREMKRARANWLTFSPAGGESRPALRDRIKAFIEEIAAAHDGQTVAVFTHYGVINSLIHVFSHPDNPRRDNVIDNGSVSIFNLAGSTAVAEAINIIDHLPVPAPNPA